MFLFKKIVAPLFFPVPLCIELLLIGLVLLWFTSKQRAGRIVVTAGVALLLILGYQSVPLLLLSPLENQYAPLVGDAQAPAGPVKWIVVLGGGHLSDPRLPPGSRLSCESVMRVMEGIRIWRKNPGSKLLFSGGSVFGPGTDAEPMAQTALDLGVSAESIVLEDRSRDTSEEAQFIEPVVGKDPFILVTSASHMPRSMGLFLKRGMHPTAAPSDFRTRDSSADKGLSPPHFYPNSGNLGRAERALYEWLGLAWEKLNGRI